MYPHVSDSFCSILCSDLSVMFSVVVSLILSCAAPCKERPQSVHPIYHGWMDAGVSLFFGSYETMKSSHVSLGALFVCHRGVPPMECWVLGYEFAQL